MTFEPFTPHDCDLRDYPWMPLDCRRLLTSETWMDGPAAGKVAALSLWCEAWCQVPAGSLPDNDRILAHLSQAGVLWPKVRDHAMRGWVRCNDGRLYHPVVCEKANEAWALKQAQRRRTEAARKAKQAHRDGRSTGSNTPPVTTSVTGNVTSIVTQTPSRAGKQEESATMQGVHLEIPCSNQGYSVHKSAQTAEIAQNTHSVTENVTGSTLPYLTLPKEREVSTEATPLTPGASPDPVSASDLLWREGMPILMHLTGKSDGQCRGLLGRMRRDMQDDCPRLLLILQQARDMQPTDPVAWITAATQDRQRPAYQRRPTPSEAVTAAFGPSLYAGRFDLDAHLDAPREVSDARIRH